jgi:hypothetical protein
MRPRRAFALLTVLWVMLSASLLALAGALESKGAVGTAGNRIAGTRASWAANACMERVLGAVDLELAAAYREGGLLRAWRNIGNLPLALNATECDVRLEPAGARLDVNAADSAVLLMLFRVLDLDNPEALVDRLLDWRDDDDHPRLSGAEFEWYVARSRVGPRNGPLADIAELRRVAGFDSIAGLGAYFGVEPGRIYLGSAPTPVLASVPGFTAEVIARIEFERGAGRAIPEVHVLAATVSPSASDSLMANFPRITALTTNVPDAWILRVSATSGSPPLTVAADARLTLGNGRAVVTRRRSWQ